MNARTEWRELLSRPTLSDHVVQVYQDEGFLADARRFNLIIEPMTGERVQQIVEKAVATPPALVAKAKEALEWK